ncbi:hypothetical protein EYF80_066248 [Liparis tanakae]|uniref:Uncharacterized protein n=1 Tax=Liparis tanakae TaxID=230148 RepID=A0A4Z2E4Y2_9TELE|nr:hypothetical protein EYF80_066248 [Liparis tanakae]
MTEEHRFKTAGTYFKLGHHLEEKTRLPSKLLVIQREHRRQNPSRVRRVFANFARERLSEHVEDSLFILSMHREVSRSP